MRWRELLRREVAVVLGARVTWLVLAAAAWLVGHSFVLAVDLFSAASRSALGFELMVREMDVLAGIVRPTLGGLHVAASLLLPVAAARGLAIERERGSYGALALACGGTSRVVAAKALAASLAGLFFFVPLLVLLLAFAFLGGHIDVPETAVALLGHALHVLAFTAVSVAAAAATRTVAQATTIAVGVSLVSWSIDAGEGFAALAWLGRLDWASVSRRLSPFEQGVLPLGSIGWLLSLAAMAFAVALLTAQVGSARSRWAPAVPVFLVGALALYGLGHVQRGYDWSEQRRASLPPAAVDALRRLDEPIRIEMFLDRDDGRRAQVERDLLAKLRLARPDLVVDSPLDRRESPREGERDEGYGRIIVHVGDASRETRSTSRRELTTLVFEAVGKPLPDWSQPPYPGYPIVIEGSARTAAALFAYVLLPGAFLLAGWLAVRSRRRTA